MGVALIDPSKSHKYKPTFFDAAVSAGLVGLWFLNTDIDNAAFNLATQKRNKIIGDPVGYAAQIRFTGAANYIETDVAETVAMTVMCVARTTDTMADNAHRPAYVSNNSSDSENPAVTSYGYQLWPLDGDSMISAAARYTNNEQSTGTSGGVQLNGPSTGDWAFFCSRVDSTRNILDNLTASTSVSQLAYSFPRYLSRGKLRIGSGYNAAYTGISDLAFVAVWSRVLTDQERDAMYVQIRAILHDLFALTV